MRYRAKIIWAYLVELVLAGLLVVWACVLYGVSYVGSVVQSFANDVATLYCAVFFAAALAFLWTFYSKVDSKFYVWLDQIGAYSTYINATVYVIAIEGATTLVLTFSKINKDENFSLFAAFLFFLAIINSCTMIANVVGLMKLQTLFHRLSAN